MFGVLYEDLSPDSNILSNGDMENIQCGFRMSKKTLEKANIELQHLQELRMANVKRMQKIQCEMQKI